MEEFLSPEKILDQLELTKNMSGAEFGCGTGHWAIELAKRLTNGIVYAIDVQEAVLSSLKSRAEQEYVTNLRTLQGDLSQERGSGLPSKGIDIVLIPNMLFQVEDRKAVIEEAKRVLRQEGIMVVIDWKKEKILTLDQGYAPTTEIKKISLDLGLEIIKEFSAGSHHWGLVLRQKINQ